MSATQERRGRGVGTAETRAGDPVAPPAADTPAGPVVLEFGRYRVSQAPDGAWIIGRAVNICATCQGCGCGDQAELIQVPAFVIKMAKSQGGGLMAKLKAMRHAQT